MSLTINLHVDGNALVPRLEVAGILHGEYFVVLDVPRGGERCR